MTGRALTVVGDSLLDRDVSGDVHRVAPDAPVPVLDEHEEVARPGGAGLAALLAAQDGRPVTLVTALGPDWAGEQLARLLDQAGVRLIDLGLRDGCTPEKIRLRAAGHPLVRWDRGGPPGRPGRLTPAGREALLSGPVLVADYGRGLTAALRGDLAALRGPLVWDPHPRGVSPVPATILATPNDAEARHLTGQDGTGLRAETARARQLRRGWGCGVVAVTLGARGALVVADEDSPPLVVPAAPVDARDTCGAGDRFAATAAAALADGALPSEAVALAVAAATDFVAGGAAAGLRPPGEPAAAGLTAAGAAAGSAARVRAAGGTVVATGGCFDLLHAGHVAVLEAARSLGDCLVVLLNSDASVRRLKGPTRPLVPEADRAAVLRGLGCVDDVVIFEEDTPAAALRSLRPDVFAKGGDYSLSGLPEAPVLAGWGGQAVVLPYLPGRSTTTLLEEAHRRART